MLRARRLRCTLAPALVAACLVPTAALPARAGEDPTAPAADRPGAPAAATKEPDRTLTLTVGGLERRALLHVPPVPAETPPGGWPVVIALHGAAMNGPMMAWFSGLSATADAERFVVVYPDGTGRGPFLVWNAGGFGDPAGRPDDVAFIDRLLDAVAEAVPVDPTRVYACGMSNGGMMCYRLATELPGRFAAIAPVAGTNMRPDAPPQRPVPLIHFHGTADAIVPYGPEVGAAGVDAADGAEGARKGRRGPRLPGVARSVTGWVEAAGCDTGPVEETLTADGDALPVTRLRWSGGRDGCEVELVRIEGGGHTWPGQKPPVGFIGRSTESVSANALLWEFFSRHRLP
jgi:polyhydroxybutyrate depolymerase